MSTRHPLDRSTSVRVFAVHPSRLDPPAVACVGEGRRVVFARTDATPAQIGAAVLDAQSHDMPHAHTYRADMGTHWCETCDTATDYCRQSNPGALGD